MMSNTSLLNPSAEEKQPIGFKESRACGYVWSCVMKKDLDRCRVLQSRKCQAESSFYFDSACPRRLRGLGYSFIYFIWFTSGSEKNSLFLDPPNEKQWGKKITTLGKYCRKVPCRYGNRSFPVRQQPHVILDATCETMMLWRLSFICATY